MLWRKRSFGTRVKKRDLFVERILSVRQTYHLQGERVYPIPVDAMHAFMHNTAPDLTWIHDLNSATP
jgi:hypothetical protein